MPFPLQRFAAFWGRYRPFMSDFTVALGLFSIVLVVALWVGVIRLGAQERERAIADVMRHNTNLARAFEEHTIRTLAYVDEIVLLLKQRFESEGTAFDLPRFFQAMQINPLVLRSSVITDANGLIILGSHGAPPVSLADREHIQVHLQHNTQFLGLSKPVLARVNQQWSIIASRRANAPDGTLLGVVGVAVDPAYFSNFYRDLDLGKNGTVALIGTDGVIRARLAGGGQGIGDSLLKSELFRRFAVAPHGTYTATSMVDGITRLHAYRALRDYPLLVSVGVEQREALAGVEQRSQGYRLLAFVASLLILAGTGALGLFAMRREQAEAATRQMNQHLQQQTAELTAANYELAAFAYAVSHDLRAPLRAIHGYSRLLAEEHGTQLSDDGQRYLHIVQSEARRMGTLIHELLKLSRVTRAVLKYEVVDLSQLMTQQLAALRKGEPSRVVEANIAPDILVQGDRALLEIAVENLLGNAWKFTAKKASAQLSFRVETHTGEPVYVLRDNGVGFDPLYTDKLFTAFHRLHGAEYEGAGVGLATVSRIIQRHRGRIWAEGKVDQGAAFFFVLGVA